MGLLNFLPEDPNKKEAMRAGLLNLGAAMLSGRGNFGQMLGQGIGAGAQGYQSALAAQQQSALDQAQAKRWQLQNQTSQAALDEPANIAKILSQSQPGAAPAGASASQSLVGGGPSPSSVPSVASLPKLGQPAPAQRESQYAKYMQYGDALSQAGKVTEAKQYYDMADKLKPKLKEQRALTVDGKRVMANVYDDGRTEAVDGFAPDAEKLHFANTGGSTVGLDQFTGKPINTIANTQSPDNRASNLRMAADAAAARAQSDRHFGAGKVPSGYRANPDGSLSAIPGGPADKTANLTEDQGKATGWLVQAENAYKNMMAVGKGKDGKPTSAAKPGVNDALAAIPSFGATSALANTFRGADRQKFRQSSSSLSEALLRAATGAGVNKEEAEQKVQELTPQFGEADEVTQQKFAAIPLYIESLKVRAGPGAKKAAGIVAAQNAPQPGTVKGGYVFKGGNPADKANWTKQ